MVIFLNGQLLHKQHQQNKMYFFKVPCNIYILFDKFNVLSYATTQKVF